MDDPVLVLDRSEDLWCRGYNMRSGASGIFPAFYTVEVAKEPSPGRSGRTRLDGTFLDVLSSLLVLLQPRKKAGQSSSWCASWVPSRSPSTRATASSVLPCRR